MKNQLHFVSLTLFLSLIISICWSQNLEFAHDLTKPKSFSILNIPTEVAEQNGPFLEHYVSLENDLVTDAKYERRSGRTTSCSTDTVSFPQARATGLQALNINNATSAEAVSQYFNAPQSITVRGFDFYAYKLDDIGGITINVLCELYLAGPDSMPTGAALASVNVAVDTSFNNGSLATLKKQAIFASAVTVNQPYVVVVSNFSPIGIGMLSNSYQAVPADGQMSWLAGIRIFGTWIRSYAVNVGGTVFDADWLMHPYVAYDLTADFMKDVTCLDTANTPVNFTNASSPILYDLMYNQAAFVGSSPLSSTWDFGDGSATVQDSSTTHTYAVVGAYTVSRTDSLFGWSTTCVDEMTMDFQTNDLMCPGNTTSATNILEDYTSLTTDTCDGFSVSQNPLPGVPLIAPTDVTLTLDGQSCVFTVSPPVVASQTLYFEDFQNMTGPTTSVVNTVTGGPMTAHNLDGNTPNGNVAYVTDAWIARDDFIQDPTGMDTVAFSTSWYSPPGSSDDWMVTPQIANIPAGTKLSWDALAPDALYPDGYEVYVSIGGATPTDFLGVDGTLVFTIAGEQDTWNKKEVDLDAFAGENIYIAFRNNSIDQFLLMIDDISVFVPVDNDVSLDSVSNQLLGEYHATTLQQFTGCNFELGCRVENVGGNDALEVVVIAKIELDGSIIDSVFSDTVQVLSPGMDSQLVFSQAYSPALEGDYRILYEVRTTSPDNNSLNDVLNSPIRRIVPNYMARDDDQITGNLGIGVGPNQNSILGQNFTLKSDGVVDSITFFLGGSTLGDSTAVRIYNTDPIDGKPTTLIDRSESIVITPSEMSAWVTLGFSSPVNLTAGTYYFGVEEHVDNISLGYANNIFTPGATWINWNTIPGGDWSNNEDFNFEVSYLLRPIFSAECMLSCIVDQVTDDLVLADYRDSIDWNCGGTLIQSPAPGAPFTGPVDVTITVDTFSCIFNVMSTQSVLPLPYCENFDDLPVDNTSFAPGAEPNPAPDGLFSNGLINVQSDLATQDWYGRSTSTGSSNTGPSGDHTSGSGVYLFVEDGFGNHTDITLETPKIFIESDLGATFEYYAHSRSAVPNANNYLIVQIDTGNLVWTTIDSFTRLSTTDTWFARSISLNDYIGAVARFRFVCNNSFTSFQHDIAIDDLCIRDLAMSVSLTTVDNLCGGANEGKATANVMDGFEPFTFQWSRNSSDTNMIGGLTAGPISVTVTDALGQIATATDTIFDDTPDIVCTTSVEDYPCESIISIDTIYGGTPKSSCNPQAANCSMADHDTLGFGTTTNTSTGYPAPFGNWYWGARHQILYRASELQAMGLSAGLINSIAFDVAQINGTTNYSNYQIKMTCTADTLLSGGWIPDAQVVRFPASYTVSVGWNTLTFDEPYAWDGISNIVVELCFNNVGFTNNSATRWTNTGYTSVRYYRADISTVCSNTTSTTGTSSNRPNTVFGHCPFEIQPYDVLWSTGDTTLNTTVTEPGDYYVTITDDLGCVKVDTVTVSTILNDPPTASCVTNSDFMLDTTGNVTISAPSLNMNSTDDCTPDDDLRYSFSGTDVTDTTRMYTCQDVGNVQVQLYVWDEDDLVSSCLADFNIIDETSPVPVCNDITVYLDAAGMASLTAADSTSLVAGAMDLCSDVTASFSQTTFDCSAVGTPIDITVTYMDESLNETSCVSSVLAIDTFAPTAICGNVNVPLNNQGIALVPAFALLASSFDICDGTNVKVSYSSTDPDSNIAIVNCSYVGVGPVDVPIYVYDQSGNMATCIGGIQATDAMAPQAVCNDITIDLGGMAQKDIAGADSAAIIAGSSDNCLDFATVVFDPPMVTCADAGNMVAVQVTITDPAGNADMCVANVSVVSSGSGGIVYVDQSASGNADGSSWADAYTNLSDALNPANAPSCGSVSEIWVATGNYVPTDSAGLLPTDANNRSFVMLPDVGIYGGFLGIELNRSDRNYVNNTTTLDGANSVYHVVLNANNGLDTTAKLDGFTITGGDASGSGPINNKLGGGMYNHNSSPLINHCRFENNNAVFGGGLLNRSSAARILNSYFISNSAAMGGGAFNWSNTVSQYVNCVFSNNNATKDGGGMMNNKNTNAEVINSSFGNNLASRWGGGCFSAKTSTSIMYNDVLWGNSPEQLRSDGSSSYDVMYSDVQGGFVGIGNIDADPLFTNVLANDLSIPVGSPLNGAGNNGLVPADIIEDIIGNDRFFGTVDMGAFEVVFPLRLAQDDQSLRALVYPNPSTDIINVELTDVQKGIFSWQLKDLEGRVVRIGTSFLPTFQIDLNGAPSNIYFLTIIEGSQTTTVRFVKIKS